MSLKDFIYRIAIVLCMFNVYCRAFEIGTQSTFSFVNDVNMYELKSAAESSIGYRISGKINVEAIFGDADNGFILRFELLEPKLYGEKFKVTPIQYEDKSSILDKNAKTTFYAHWKSGIVEKAFIQETKDSSLTNFLKSILSLFQYQLLDTERSETDISGTCQVKYIAKSSTKFAKVKTECSSDFEVSKRLDAPLGAEVRYTRVNYITTSTDGALSSIHSSDHHSFAVNAYPNVGFKIGSLFYLKHEGGVKECDVWKLDSIGTAINTIKSIEGYRALDLSADVDEGVEKLNLIKLLKIHKENLKNEDVGKESSAIAILKLLQAGRVSKSEDFLRILNARLTQGVTNQVLDLLAAVQTDESHKAFRKYLNFTSEENFDNIERYLQSLSVGVRPRESVIRDLLDVMTNEVIDNEKLKDTLVQTISSMSHKFAVASNDNYKIQVVQDVQKFLTNAVEKCADDNDCKVIYIRGLLNLQSPDTVTDLVDLALFQPYQISVMAMKALREFPTSYLHGLKRDFKKIFYQYTKKYDSSARTIALDILLDLDPSKGDMREFVVFLKSNDPAYEVRQYLVQKLRLRAEKCSEFREMLREALQSEPEVYNWNSYGALKGLSTALSRKFSKGPSFNGSMLSVQEIKGGVLKRGTADLLIHYKEEKFNIFTLGLFAGGLSSFISSDDEVDPEEDTTPTAGMELAVQGSYLRPLTFFKGQGELMGHVWSGTASEPTSAYQGITMLQDHSQKMVLNNGAVLDFSSFGTMSMDLNGKMEISLWYKNANSEVVQNIGMALLTSLTIDTSIIRLSVEMTVSEQPQINLASKIDFSSKTAICMMLSQPDSILTHKISRKIDIPESKKPKALRSEINLRYKIPGLTHVLNQKNNDMCAVILQ